MKKSMAEIDGGKLLRALEVRSLVPAQVSRDMGFSDTHISQAVQRGCINMPSVKLLETVFGIPYSEYEPDPEPHPLMIDPVEEESVLPWDCDQTYEPKRTLTGEDIEELCKAMHETIYTAVRDALKEVFG